MPRRSTPQFTPEEMFQKMAEGLKAQAARPNIYAYRPHKKQLMFHTNPKHTRLYIGGNRSGKTVGGGTEAAYWLMKKHPYRKLPLPEGPIRMRGVAVDFNYGVDMIMLPELVRWIPPSFLKKGSFEESYDSNHRLLTLANGSFIEFRSYEQDLEKFAGTSRHATWFDEEPPKHIYDECMARHVDTDGFTWITMTPVEGMTWVYEGLYLPGIEGDEDIGVIEIETDENTHLSPEAIRRFNKGLDEDTKKARNRGEFVAFGGRVYKMFNETDHVISPIDPSQLEGWEIYVSIDHGYNNPTAILWHAVSPGARNIITFNEIYEREVTVDVHAASYHDFNTKTLKREPDFTVGDPAMQQRNGVTGTSIVQEYADRGVFVAPANNDVLSGVNRVIQYMKVDSPDLKPHPVTGDLVGDCRWHVTANCTNTINELKKLRWKTFTSRKMQFDNNKKEEIHKKDDHAADSLRYFFTFMPDLSPDEPTDPAEQLMRDIEKHSGMLGAVAPAPVVPVSSGQWADLVTSNNDTHWNVELGETW